MTRGFSFSPVVEQASKTVIVFAEFSALLPDQRADSYQTRGQKYPCLQHVQGAQAMVMGGGGGTFP